MIEKMVLFENQKQLEETRDELERCKRFSFRLYAKELPLELTLSHEENNEVNAVKAILKDMEKGNWPMLHYFRMHCKSDSNPPKILQANAIGCADFRYRQGYAQGKLCYTGNGNEPCCAEQCLSRS